MYVEALMNWVQAQLDDEKVFPQKIGEGAALRCCYILSHAAADRGPTRRCALPEEFPVDMPHDPAETVPCVCAHLL